MVVGEKMRLFIPSTLAYGNRPAGSIPGGSVLIFEVELIAINS
jgi:peptidylprolyl isomerase